MRGIVCPEGGMSIGVHPGRLRTKSGPNAWKGGTSPQAGVLKILAEDEVRFKETLVELRKRAWLMTPDPLCSA
jgi:hypothetical protein